MTSIVLTDTEIRKGELNNHLRLGWTVFYCVKLDTKHTTLFILKKD